MVRGSWLSNQAVDSWLYTVTVCQSFITRRGGFSPLMTNLLTAVCNLAMRTAADGGRTALTVA